MLRTLGADQNERDFGNVAELGHFRVVIVDGVETGFVLQAEHEYDRVHPSRKLIKFKRIENDKKKKLDSAAWNTHGTDVRVTQKKIQHNKKNKAIRFGPQRIAQLNA